MWPMSRRNFIIANTRVASPLLCPEVSLRLITPECPLWKATEKDLKAMQLTDPYWGFCRAGGQALARYVLDHPETVRAKRVLDFGAGCGVEAFAAAKAGASSVLASDTDEVAVEAVAMNAELNGVRIEKTARDLIGDPLKGIDVVLAGDMFYDPAFSCLVLDWLALLATSGITVLLGDPGRGNLAGVSLNVVGTYMAPADVDVDGRHLRETKVCALRWRTVDNIFHVP